MFEKKQILVPIDFNEKSLDVVMNYAVPVAKKYGSRIYLLHVIEETGLFSGFFSSVDTDKVAKALEEKLKEIAHQIEKENHLEVVPMIVKGRITNKITEVANMLDVAVIVICAANKHSSKDKDLNFAGANTYKLIRTSERPVLVVKKPYQYSDVKKILLPIDLTPASRQKVPHVVELAKRANAHVVILGGAWGPEKEIIEKKMQVVLKQVTDYLSERKIPNETVFFNSLQSEKEYFKTICTYSSENNIDVMVGSGRGDFTQEYVVDGITEYLLKCSEIPILSILPEEKGIISVAGRI